MLKNTDDIERIQAHVYELFDRLFDDNEKFAIGISWSYGALNFTFKLGPLYLYIGLDGSLRQGIFARSEIRGEYEMRLLFLYVLVIWNGK